MTNTGRQTRQKLREPLQRAQWLYLLLLFFFFFVISRAKLAAIAAAVIRGYSNIATDSLTSLHQIKKQLSHPNLHHHHIQGDVVQSINYLCVHFSDSLHRWGKTWKILVIFGNLLSALSDTGSVQMPLIAAFLVLFASPLLSANAQGSWFSPDKMFS